MGEAYDETLAGATIFTYMKIMSLAFKISGVVPAMQGVHDRAVGERLRVLRKRKGVSLQLLSAASGLSIGYLSQVERGLSSASIRALSLIADGLGVGLDAIFLPSEAPAGGMDRFVFRVAERKMLGFWRDQIEKELLTPAEGGAISMFMVHIGPGGISGEADYTHTGEEAGMVLDGVLDLSVDGQHQTLHAGDAFRFRSDRPHRFWNASAGDCRVLWILAATR